ncbi:MAG: carbohydrate ABC transporter permease [Eubacteriales bacterium]|nr:carbohydrate ABC transporter permease [Eubacteriales bacterium]
MKDKNISRITAVQKDSLYRESAEVTKRKKVFRNIGKIILSSYRFILLFCIGIIILYPLMSMLTIAIRPVNQMTDLTIIWIPKSLTIENILDAFKYMKFGTAFINSMILTLGASFFQMISCSLAGYGLARFRFKGRELLSLLAIFTILVPPQTIAIPTYVQFFKFDYFGLGQIVSLLTGRLAAINMIGSFWTMLLPALLGVGIRGGLFIYIFRQSFRNMPKELEDAAYIDGCGALKTFVKVILPNSLNVFLIVFLFSVVWYWNDYLNVAMYMGSTITLSTKLIILGDELGAILKSTSNLGNNPYILSAILQSGCLLVMAPLILMHLFLQRFFTESIERSGIVG